MTTLRASQDLPVPAQMVWNVIGNFNALPDWHPAVEGSEQTEEDGATIRRLTLVGGGAIIEKLEKVDDKERLYTYSILESPLPVANYTATIRVREKKGGCSVEWASEFEPSGASENEVTKAIRGIYEAGFGQLKTMFGA